VLTRGDFAKTLGVVVAWQALLTVLGAVLEPALSLYQAVAQDPAPGPTLLSHTYRWDARWFHEIMEGSYATNPAAPAFYPLFPLVVWLVQHATFGVLGFLAVGLLVNTVATWLGVTALLKIAREFVDAPWWVVAVFLTTPTAFFLHAFYSEAVFIALGFWAYLFALRRQWMWMGLCLIPLTAARITAVLFVALCFLEYCRARDWGRSVLWFPASALGFACYAGYLRLVSGDALGMTKAYAAGVWDYHVFNPNIAATLWHLADGVFPLDYRSFVDNLIPLAGLAVLFAASVYLIVLRGRGIPLGVFGLLSFVMFTLNSNTVSVHRYLLPCLGIYLALLLAVQRNPRFQPVLWGVLYLGSLLQAVLFTMFIQATWAG
jgi:hypothetical protein